MASPEATEQTQVPEGTFVWLSSLPEGKLGNAYTKRFVTVMLNDEPRRWALVRMRMREKGYSDLNYSLGITNDDQLVDYSLRRNHWRPDNVPEPLTPPPLSDFLAEIRRAEKIQPTLRPRIQSLD